MENGDDRRAFEALNARLRTLLPPDYQDSYEEVQPVSMGSAGLKYGADGAVAWDEIWGSFCDLAMAGGPPHKGRFLGPGQQAEIDAQLLRYDDVAEEICRGVRMVTGLRAYVSMTPGWVSVTCLDDAMAGWLTRAILMENVAARSRGSVLELPAAPHFRLEKEIKNVITVIAKTCHYWLGHVPADQRRAVADVFLAMARESPFVAPDLAGPDVSAHEQRAASTIAALIHRETGLRRSSIQCAGWLGVECPHVPAAVWMMRALVATNVASRREDAVLFVPVNPATDPQGRIVAGAVARVNRYATLRGALSPL